MGLVRMHHQNAIHFVTNRCFQERLLLLPSRTVNHIIGYWFARAHTLYGQGLEIYAFIFLSNPNMSTWVVQYVHVGGTGYLGEFRLSRN